jgi:hypothetical protein
MCDVNNKTPESRIRTCAIQVFVFVACCQFTVTLFGQVVTTLQPFPTSDPPTNPSNQITAYSLVATNLTIDYWIVPPTAGGTPSLAGAVSPAGPFNITWNTPTGDIPTAQYVTVAFSVAFGGLPARDYTVTTVAGLNDGQYQITADDMQAFVDNLLKDISTNLTRACFCSPSGPHCCIPFAFIYLDQPVQVKITPTQQSAAEAKLATIQATALIAARDKAAANAKAAADAVTAATAANETAKNAAEKNPSDADLGTKAKAAAQTLEDVTKAKALADQLNDQASNAASAASAQAFLKQHAADKANAANKPVDKTTPQPKPVATANNLLIGFQRIITKPGP